MGVLASIFGRAFASEPSLGRIDREDDFVDVVLPIAEHLADRDDALQRAVIGLQTVAPDRVPGRYALRLAQQEGAEPEELVALLPRAIAAAPDQQAVDSLLA